MTLKETLYEWITTILEIDAIYAYQNAPAPAFPYATIEIQSIKSNGTNDKILNNLLIDKSVDISYEQLFEAFCIINFYGDAAFNLATQLKNSLNFQSVVDLFNANEIGYMMTSEVRKIREVVRQEYEQRAQFDIFFYIKESTIENIETIQKVEITNEIDGTTTIVEK